MPTLFIFRGMRFFFYSNEHLPIHVHVRNGDGEAKIEVESVKIIDNKGIKSKGLKTAIELVKENRHIIIGKWNEYHGY